MRSSVLFALVLAAAAIALTAGAGVVYGLSVHAVKATNTDALRQTSASTPLFTASGFKTTILSVKLPAGSWVITTNAVATTFTEGDVVHCAIFEGTTKLNEAAAPVTGSLEPVDVIAAVHSSAVLTVSLRCWQEADVHSTQNSINAGAVLWAHKSSSLNH